MLEPSLYIRYALLFERKNQMEICITYPIIFALAFFGSFFITTLFLTMIRR